MKRVLILLVVCIFSSCSKEKKEYEAPISGEVENILSLSERLDEEKISSLDSLPSFPGGEDAMFKHLIENVNYPKEAQDSNVSGKVIVQFVVEKSGKIGSPRVLKGIGFGCDEEALRVVESMPNWNPGMKNDEPVRVYFNLPVVFRLDEKEG